ncbi:MULTISPECIES: hypothetical protein [Bacillus]|uniref:hypothetical protein n=1 Tax=Bacillus TaxID=1386 RepID=UPI001F1BED54|nr:MULTISPECIES: hypothetical protein [Bacillus]MDH3099405.1 hypothetical protein [Bacillus velezensis]MEC3676886.1 hypothetical protein [Bacillus velezensis]UJX16507.1 hypothetical protein L3V45_09370 [Bacillus sp. R45]URJ76097.1 hypothetical protein MF619_001858 [Bacillus velezensis]URJ79998.1 hypothetical protein MF621_001730 [Bacillus velezensis]
MKTRKVTIPTRDTNGFLIGFREVNALWECPTCGGEMGNPQLRQYTEDGFFGQIHTWENPCGHIAHYKNLQIVGDAE